LPLGFEAGLIPRRFFFIAIFPFGVACPANSSRYQQDLPDATLFCHCLSFGRPIARRELEGLCPRSQYLLLSQKWGEESTE
jgi:hypothetical protein